jgi:hypothetical protein
MTSCAESYTLRTNYGTYRNLPPEHVIDISLQLDSAATEGDHSFILYYRKRLIGRNFLMEMIDTMPGQFRAIDYEDYEYFGNNLWFLRKFVDEESECTISLI